MMFHYCRFDRS